MGNLSHCWTTRNNLLALSTEWDIVVLDIVLLLNCMATVTSVFSNVTADVINKWWEILTILLILDITILVAYLCFVIFNTFMTSLKEHNVFLQ